VPTCGARGVETSSGWRGEIRVARRSSKARVSLSSSEGRVGVGSTSVLKLVLMLVCGARGVETFSGWR
jgi:hypothetical protein